LRILRSGVAELYQPLFVNREPKPGKLAQRRCQLK
jgi:hypothetical protein